MGTFWGDRPEVGWEKVACLEHKSGNMPISETRKDSGNVITIEGL